MQYPHLAQRLFNRPLAITPDKAEMIMAALADRLGIAHLFRDGQLRDMSPRMFEDDEGYTSQRIVRDRGYDLIEGIAVIPVCGTLVQKLGSLRPYSGMTGYDGIRRAFMMAIEDQDAAAVCLDIDSPGGEVAGCFDLVDEIFNARGEKPIGAILTESAYSAAYAIASAVDPGRIFVPRTGGTGSIGVIALHVDFSQALSENGIKVTIINYGERKPDGHPEIPLSAEARERFQADIDTMGELFVETVARNRGLAASAVREQQALTYLGSAGVSVGLADAVLAPDAAFRTLLDELG